MEFKKITKKKSFKQSLHEVPSFLPQKSVRALRSKNQKGTITEKKYTEKLTTSAKDTPVDTSWGSVSNWYDEHLQGKKTYHETIIYPGLMRRLGDVRGVRILDLACGQGIFSHKLALQGANVIGVDLASELIDIAKKVGSEKHHPDFFASPSHDLYMIKNATVDTIIISLALQNIERVKETFDECKRVLKKEGRMLLVLNHPSFRNPKESSWGYNEREKIQYRRIDSYLSESKIKIDMTPGSRTDKKFTYSFHRPLQFYSKFLEKAGFLIKRLEEWESDRESEPGVRQLAENKSRKEIPLFLLIEAVQ